VTGHAARGAVRGRTGFSEVTTSVTVEEAVPQVNDVPHYPMFIDGDWVDGASTHEIHAPATGRLAATVAVGSIEQADQAVDAALKAHRSGVWSSLHPERRADLIDQLADHLGARQQQLATLVTDENGASIRQASAFHVGVALASMRYFAQLARTFEFERKLDPVELPLPAQGFVRYEPVGVVAAILPFNFPMVLGAWKIGPALAAGNTLVVKPDENTPLTLLEIGKAAEAVGLPAGVFNVITGDGPTIGGRLSTHPDVRKIAFTGSTEVGRLVMQGAAANIKKVTLELGGKGPSIILDDADLDLAVPGSLFAFLMYNGQVCESGTRVLVPRSRHEEIVQRMVTRLASLQMGDPHDPATDFGPIFSAEAKQRIEGYIEAAKADGATVAFEGELPDAEVFRGGHWVRPTILTNVTNVMPIAREEVFGPVGVVIPYDTVDEAVEIANDTEYGLAAGVWGADEDRAMDAARRLEAGTVWVNDWHAFPLNGPFGGYKQSGLGRELGAHALHEYTEVKYIHRAANQDPTQRLYGLLFGH
jgi:acyl-CoA reductase-like NAD-dependent aldehyde dehydrogenase